MSWVSSLVSQVSCLRYRACERSLNFADRRATFSVTPDLYVVIIDQKEPR